MTQSLGVVVLGSTGSVGVSTLDVLAQHQARFHVVALAAHRNVNVLFEQCLLHQPEFAVLADDDAADELNTRVKQAGLDINILSGAAGVRRVAALGNADVVMAAVVGAAGLLPALDAVQAGKRVLIANKEPLVMLGGLFVREARRSGATILPIDSEHNAIFQCLPASCGSGIPISDGPSSYGVNKVILTASGGPFRDCSIEELEHVTPEQACLHPNWVMGKKISVDSATMMNKGLEIIEATCLFGLSPKMVDVVIHPQSIVHSLVEYVDGSVLAQLANPDMRIPIAHALAWPGRMPSGAEILNLNQLGTLEFEPPRLDRFPCLRIAREVASRGGTAPSIANAANEVAVENFLNGKLKFTDIPWLISETIEHVTAVDDCDLQSVLTADEQARMFALEKLATRSSIPDKGGRQVNAN
jgi:1-deoxy-D-xylulose-5-phosphate reductoisomerase